MNSSLSLQKSPHAYLGNQTELPLPRECTRCHSQPAVHSLSFPFALRNGNVGRTAKCLSLRRGRDSCVLEGSSAGSEGRRGGSGRRSMVGGGIAAGIAVCMSAVVTTDSTTLEIDHGGAGVEVVPYKAEGYSYWDWRGFRVHYISDTKSDNSLPPILLIHGFGASAFHWSIYGHRYNIPALAAKGHRVYAMCLLGFGWSEKTTAVQYSQQLWSEQISDFIREVVGSPVIVAGNSLGAFSALSASVTNPELVKGLVILNGAAGGGRSEKKVVQEQDWVKKNVVAPLQKLVERAIIYFTFLQAKQPARIESVLRQVYKDQRMVDDYLVQSIVKPSLDPGAAQVYYKVATEMILHPSNIPLDQLYSQLEKPLLLLWGVYDPWMSPRKAEMIKQMYSNATYVPLQAGHCPHDEVPEQVNEALAAWISQLPA